MPRFGKVSEWSKEHAWKACVPQKGTAGSNPALSEKDGYTVLFYGCV